VDIAKGQAYRREAGVEHNVVNAGKEFMSFIEIEYK
jgi:mannose-6-phosphate isomerase-like protein (cupin superfamily)